MSGVTDNYGFILPADGEPYDVAIPNANNVGIDAQLKARENQAKGVVAANRYNTTSPPTSSKTVFTNIASFTFKAGRRYRISFTGNGTISDTTSTFVLTLSSSLVSDPAAQITGLTQIRPRAVRVDIPGEGRAFDFSANNVTFPADTTLQIKFTGERLNGAGNIVITGNDTDPCEIVIEDLGKQF